MGLNITASDEATVVEKDVIATGGPLESDIYPMTIDLAYVTTSKKGAAALNLQCKTDTGQSYKETIYFSSGDAKGNKTYFKNKAGENQNLPGFSTCYNITAAAAKLDFMKIVTGNEFETKTLSLYDYASRENKDVECDMVVTQLHGKTFLAGVKRFRKNKQKANDAGKYVDTPDERIMNEIDKVFFADTLKTVYETVNKVEKPEIHKKWLEKWKGNTHDTFKEVTAPAVDSTPTDENPFG